VKSGSSHATAPSLPIAQQTLTGADQVLGNNPPRKKHLAQQEPMHCSPVAPPRRKPPHHQVQHRVSAIMAHIPWYGFKSQARLAADVGFSKSAISRLLRGECIPSLALACALNAALERRLGRKLGLQELFSMDGTYPTPSACQLVGCANCLPPEAYDRDDNLRPEFRNVKAGEWSVTPQQPGAGAAFVSIQESSTPSVLEGAL